MRNSVISIIVLIPLFLRGMGGLGQIEVDWNGDRYPDVITWRQHTVEVSLNQMGVLQPAGVLRDYPDQTINTVETTLDGQSISVGFTDGGHATILLGNPISRYISPPRIPRYDPPPNTVDFDLIFSSPREHYSFRSFGMADLDGDGADEVLTTRYTPALGVNAVTLDVWKSTGDNQLAVFDTLPGAVSYSTESVLKADVVNDGEIWTLFTLRISSEFTMLKIVNDHLLYYSLMTAGWLPYSVDVADIDQDGITDLVTNQIWDGDHPPTWIYFNEYAYQTPNHQNFYYDDYFRIEGVNYGVSYIRAGDIDGDGMEEVVLGSRGALYYADTTYIYYFDKAPDSLQFTLKRIPIPYAFNPAYIGLCDSDHDGVDEILAMGPLVLSLNPWRTAESIILVKQEDGHFQITDMDTTTLPQGGSHQNILKEYEGIYYFLAPFSWLVETAHGVSSLFLFKIESGQIQHLWHSPLIDPSETWSGAIGDTDGDGLLEVAGVFNTWSWLLYETPDIHTGIAAEPDHGLPESFTLGQPYPNPFNAAVHIPFRLPVETHIRLTIYDVTGRQVWQPAPANYQAGNYNFSWLGEDQNGRTVASGVYFLRIQAGDLNQTRKIVLLR